MIKKILRVITSPLRVIKSFIDKIFKKKKNVPSMVYFKEYVLGLSKCNIEFKATYDNNGIKIEITNKKK